MIQPKWYAMLLADFIPIVAFDDDIIPNNYRLTTAIVNECSFQLGVFSRR